MAEAPASPRLWLGSRDSEFPSLTCSMRLGLGPEGWGGVVAVVGAQAPIRHQRIPTASPEAAAWQ